jgi:hypothetical protein
MAVTRIVALAFAIVVGIAAFDTAYAETPCCNWVGGKYINKKTGKEVKPPKGAVAPTHSGATPAGTGLNQHSGGGGYKK